MKIAIIGCGYVADYYLATLPFHPGLELAGVADRDAVRSARFAAHHKVREYGSVDALLADPTITLVLNLTNPRSHYDVSKRALEAGKHVYSEKPIATDWDQAVELFDLARSEGLRIASAPCTVLGEAAQTAWKAIREGKVGTVKLVYAELEDGLLHRENFRSWATPSGNHWPYIDEFEVGCTLEHAGYYVSWLAAMFGAAESVTSYASCQISEKAGCEGLDPPDTPDYSSGSIRFASGVVARVTCSLIATHDHSLRIFGDEGTLAVHEAWDFGSAVTLSKWSPLRFRAEKRPMLARMAGLGPRRVPLVRRPPFKMTVPGASRIDFARGVAELAESIEQGRPCRLSPEFSLHINEIVLTLQNPAAMGSPRRLTTTFPSMEPMPWAR